MQAVIVNEFGDIEATGLGHMPGPIPEPGEVLVRNNAVAVNYVDLLVIAGTYQFRPECPFVPGKAPAGVVEAVGDGVDRFKVGDRVLAMAEEGGYAEQVTVAADQCYGLPDSMPYAAAAAMALVYDTAWVALRDRVRVREGEVALILGASGGVGYAALQLAHAMGVRTLAGIARPEKAEFVLDTGAEAVIDLSVPDLREALRRQVYEANGGKGADVILDPTTDDVPAAVRDATRGLGADICIEAAGVNPAFQACIDSVRDSGTILVLSLANPEATFDLKPYDLFSHELRIVGSNTRLNTFQRALDLVPLLDLEPIVTEVLPLTEAVHGVRRAKAGKGGKIVLDCRGPA